MKQAVNYLVLRPSENQTLHPIQALGPEPLHNNQDEEEQDEALTPVPNTATNPTLVATASNHEPRTGRSDTAGSDSKQKVRPPTSSSAATAESAKANATVVHLPSTASTQTAASTPSLEVTTSDVPFNPRVHRIMDDLQEIQDSPYKETANAEVGEPCFQHLQQVLATIEQEPGGRRSRHIQVSQDAQLLFQDRAADVVKTYYLIRDSGILFSESWIGGNFVSATCRRLPKKMLVFLLQASRFPTSSTDVLRKIFRALEVPDFFYTAMKSWGDDFGFLGAEDFPLFHQARRSKKKGREILNHLIGAHRGIKQSHLHCILFVVRTFECLEVSQSQFKLEGTLLTKVVRCLTILHDAIQERLQGTGQGGLVQRTITADHPTRSSMGSRNTERRNRSVARVSDVSHSQINDDSASSSDDKADYSCDDPLYEQSLSKSTIDRAALPSKNDTGNQRIPRVSDALPESFDKDAPPSNFDSDCSDEDQIDLGKNAFKCTDRAASKKAANVNHQRPEGNSALPPPIPPMASHQKEKESSKHDQDAQHNGKVLFVDREHSSDPRAPTLAKSEDWSPYGALLDLRSFISSAPVPAHTGNAARRLTHPAQAYHQSDSTVPSLVSEVAHPSDKPAPSGLSEQSPILLDDGDAENSVEDDEDGKSPVKKRGRSRTM